MDHNIDIVRFIQDATGMDLHQQGDLYKGTCCFHRDASGGPERTPSFTIYSSTQSFYCFSCSVSGDIISFCMNFYGDSYKDALDRLGLKDRVYDTEKIQKKLEATIHPPQNLIALWLSINKILKVRNLSLSDLAIQVDKTLDLSEQDRYAVLINILKNIQ